MSKAIKKKNIIKILVSLIILLILVLFSLLNERFQNIFYNLTGIQLCFERNEQYNNTYTNELIVYFVNVGQADCILVINKNESMLIDAGNNDDGSKVVNFIRDKGINNLKYLIGTHPHEDHIGGLDDVINNMNIENIIMPKIQANTKTFEDVLDAISNKNLHITSPNKGDTFNIGDSNCEIMTVPILNKQNLNESSIVIRLTYGNNSFLFMGDSETTNENTRNWPKTDILKVAHHGSSTSTSTSFLKQVNPQYSIIMVGSDNKYNHPNEETLNRLNSIGSKIYRTDEKGTIEIKSNGQSIDISTEK